MDGAFIPGGYEQPVVRSYAVERDSTLVLIDPMTPPAELGESDPPAQVTDARCVNPANRSMETTAPASPSVAALSRSCASAFSLGSP